MPNWCVQNWILKGPKDDVQRFCDTVNSCLVKPDVKPNGFGKFWLGNLCVAFGYEYSDTKSGLRGNFDPDESCCATLCHPEPEEKAITPLSIDGDTSEIRFSVTHAWGPSDWFQEMVDEQFPDLEQAWKATDEFGNFHACRGLEAFGMKKYEVDPWGEAGEWKCFGDGEEQQAADYLNKITGRTEDPITADEILYDEDAVNEKLGAYNEENEDDCVYLHVWKEE